MRPRVDNGRGESIMVDRSVARRKALLDALMPVWQEREAALKIIAAKEIAAVGGAPASPGRRPRKPPTPSTRPINAARREDLPGLRQRRRPALVRAPVGGE